MIHPPQQARWQGGECRLPLRVRRTQASSTTPDSDKGGLGQRASASLWTGRRFRRVGPPPFALAGPGVQQVAEIPA